MPGRREYLRVVALGTVSALAGCNFGQTEQNTATQTNGDETTPIVTPTPTLTPTPVPIETPISTDTPTATPTPTTIPTPSSATRPEKRVVDSHGRDLFGAPLAMAGNTALVGIPKTVTPDGGARAPRACSSGPIRCGLNVPQSFQTTVLCGISAGRSH